MAELNGEKLYNSAVAISPDGEVLAVHHKNSLYHQEESYFTPGRGGATYPTPAGRFGMIICADVYNSELLNNYRGRVTTLALSTSWAEMNTGWSNFVDGAKQAETYLLAANQPYFPDSGVITPEGKAQSHIRQTAPGIAYGYLPRTRP